MFSATRTSLSQMLLALACFGLVPVKVMANEVFTIVDAEFVDIDSTLSLNMRVQTDMPEYIVAAMEQGFAVPFMFEVEIRERSRYWFDKKVVSLRQQYLLHYLPILESYTVIDKNRTQRKYFRNRETAMYYISRVLEYPLLNVDNLRPNDNLYARVRFGIDNDELPLPLKSSSLWDNDWGLRSEWFEWPLGGTVQ